MQLATSVVQLTQTLSPLVEQAQELTALASEHLHVLVTLAEAGGKASSTVSVNLQQEPLNYSPTLKDTSK